MKLKRMVWIVISLFGLLTSCSTGSSSGGGSTTPSTSSSSSVASSTPAPLTFSNTDLAGSWRYTAKGQKVSISMTGTLTFNDNVRVIGWENDRCPGRQILNGIEFWLYASGYVKGHNQAFCADTTMETKFSMDFQGPTKKLISGIMDIHYFVDGVETYDRYDITMTK